MSQVFGRAAPWSAICLAAVLGGCTSASSGSGEGGSTLSNLLLYGGPTVPPAAPAAALEVRDCPTVDVAAGGASLRIGAGKSQLSIANVARECTGQADGSILVKVGVEGRALAGPGGTVSRSDVPIYVVLKRGDRILVARNKRVPVTVTPGDTQGAFILVEDGMRVPPGIGGEFEIEVGLGTPGGAGVARKKARS